MRVARSHGDWAGLGPDHASARVDSGSTGDSDRDVAEERMERVEAGTLPSTSVPKA